MSSRLRIVFVAALCVSAASQPVAAVAAGRSVSYSATLPVTAPAVAQSNIASAGVCADGRVTVFSIASGGTPVKLPAQGFAVSPTACAFTIDYTGLVIPAIANLRMTFSGLPGLGPLVRLAQIDGPPPDAPIAYVVGVAATTSCGYITVLAGGAPIKGIVYIADPALGGCVAHFSAIALDTSTLRAKSSLASGQELPLQVNPTKAFFTSFVPDRGGAEPDGWNRVQNVTPSPKPATTP